MVLIIVLGDYGSGKSLWATSYIARYIHDRPIYANWKLNLPDAHALTPDGLMEINHKAFVAIDEIYNWIDSRRSGADQNIFLSRILFQSRKRGIDIMIIAQLVSTIDVRFREMWDYCVKCEKRSDGFYYTIAKNSSFINYPTISEKLSFENAEKLVYPLYNSFEQIEGVGKTLTNLMPIDPEKAMPEIDGIARQCLKEHGIKYWKKGVLKDYAIERKWPEDYVDLVYNRIQRLGSS